MPSIKAVVFDIGGVLIEAPNDKINEYCAKELGVPVKAFAEEYRGFENAFCLGMSEQDFFRNMCQKLGISATERLLWTESLPGAWTPHMEMSHLVYRMHDSGYKTAVLSNTEIPTANYFRSRYICMPVDVCIFSCELGILKPQARIFRRTLHELGIEDANQAVLIDDRRPNVKPFIGIGGRGIVHTTYADTFEQLREMGVDVRKN